MAMMFYNNQSNTMYMAGHTITYDGTNRTYRLFLGNMSYSGDGKIVVAQNAWVQGHNSVVTARGCDMDIYGRYWQNTGRISPVKSFVFHEGSIFRELNTSPGTVTVYERYAPNVLTESVDGRLTHPKVQLGNVNHLETTFDLSRWTTTFDDSAEGSLTFYSGTTVTVDIGDRTAGLGQYAYKWKGDRPTGVRFTRTAKMVKRGVHVVVDDLGFRFKTGVSVFVR